MFAHIEIISVPLCSELTKSCYVMIKIKGAVNVQCGSADTKELTDSLDNLPDGEYSFLLFDKHKNRSLPQLKYLFGVVLKTISDKLSDHPPVDALYRYFEEIYAPIHTCHILGERYEYYDLKNEKSIEMDDVIEKIIHHATVQWGISIPTKEEIRDAEARELYADAYAEMWKSSFSKLNKSSSISL